MSAGRGERRLGFHLDEVDFLPPPCFDVGYKVSNSKWPRPGSAYVVGRHLETLVLQRVNDHAYDEVVEGFFEGIPPGGPGVLHVCCGVRGTTPYQSVFLYLQPLASRPLSM